MVRYGNLCLGRRPYVRYVEAAFGNLSISQAGREGWSEDNEKASGVEIDPIRTNLGGVWFRQFKFVKRPPISRPYRVDFRKFRFVSPSSAQCAAAYKGRPGI